MFDLYKSAEEYSAYLSAMTQKDVQKNPITQIGMNEFHLIADFKNFEVQERIDHVFREARRLGLNPNQQCSIWHNSPLMNLIAYEKVEYILFFLQSAKKYGFVIDLNLRDKDGKTALLFIILLGWSPCSIINHLITPENYNIPNNAGLTPIMAACALRRLDVVKSLLALGLEVSIEKEKRSPKEESKLGKFISQRHPQSQKSLVHFSVLRAGVLEDQKKESYPETVLNLLKIAQVDGFRDLKARTNAIHDPIQDVIKINERLPGTPTFICEANNKNIGGQVYLSSVANLAKLIPYCNSLQIFFDKYENISLLESIMRGTSDLLEFLSSLGCDLNAQQKNGKTAENYIRGLLHPSQSGKAMVSVLDEKTFMPICKKLDHEKVTYIGSFFSKNSFTTKVSQIIIEYSDFAP